MLYSKHHIIIIFFLDTDTLEYELWVQTYTECNAQCMIILYDYVISMNHDIVAALN